MPRPTARGGLTLPGIPVTNFGNHTMSLLCHFTRRTAREAERETFLDGRLAVLTRSGLHPVEAALLAQLPMLVHPSFAEVLVCQSRTGATAAGLHVLLPHATSTMHTYDAHHALALERNLHPGPAPLIPGVRVACAPFLPPERYDAAFCLLTRNGLSNELTQDLFEEIHGRLTPGAPLFTVADLPLESVRKLLATVFPKPAVRKLPSPRGQAVHLLTVRRPDGALKRPRDFSATFEASVPGAPPFKLTTWPGVFAHRRTDPGGLALAETGRTLVRPGDRVLDIGCGSGFVGIALAAHQPEPPHVTFLDAHARAVHAAHHNAAVNGLPDFEAHLATAAHFMPPRPDYTFALANPPYFSDYKIAEDFIRLADRALAPRGRLLLVTRQTDFYRGFLPELFQRVETLQRRGYTLFLAAKVPV